MGIGVAVQDGNIWTRSFEYVEVVLNLDDGTAEYHYTETTTTEDSTAAQFSVTDSSEEGELENDNSSSLGGGSIGSI